MGSPSSRLSDRIADRLLARIASGEWPVGTQLPGERTLADSMGVSRVSVRAALQALKTQGFLDAVQGGGTRVVATDAALDSGLAALVRVSRDNLFDLAEIRGILETWAAARAAIHAGPDNLAELDAVIEMSEQDVATGVRRTESDLRFHLAVAKASGSGLYLHLMTMLRGILEEMLDHHRYELFPTPDHNRTILDQHRRVRAAIQARDANGAAAAMRRHIDWVLEAYRRHAPPANGEI